jgi:hypothetical protein
MQTTYQLRRVANEKFAPSDFSILFLAEFDPTFLEKFESQNEAEDRKQLLQNDSDGFQYCVQSCESRPNHSQLIPLKRVWPGAHNLLD